MSNLVKRILTAIVLIVLLVLVLFVLPAPSAILFFGLILVVGAWEWAGLFTRSEVLRRYMFALLIAGLASAPFVAGKPILYAEPALYAAMAYWLLVTLLLITGIPVVGMLAIGLAGVIALVSAWYAIALLLQQPNGALLFIGCVGIVSAADIGAYFTGKSLGRHKLAPTISPGKTIEGFAGGLVLASVVAAVLGISLGRDPLVFAAGGAIIGVFSVVGDLWVSRFKRASGIKDCGRVLPGHGGVMDRIDGLIAALPPYVYLILMTAGVAK